MVMLRAELPSSAFHRSLRAGNFAKHNDISLSLLNPKLNPQKEAPKDPFAGLQLSENERPTHTGPKLVQ